MAAFGLAAFGVSLVRLFYTSEWSPEGRIGLDGMALLLLIVAGGIAAHLLGLV